MNIASLLKLIPAKTLDNLIQNNLMPGVFNLFELAKKDIIPEPNCRLQIIVFKDENSQLHAVVASMNDDFEIKKAHMRWNVAELISKINVNDLKTA